MLTGKRTIGTIAYMGGVMALPERFCWSWGQMVQYNTEYLCQPGEIVHYDRATVSYHSYARNTLVERMRGDWLLMLDTDHAFDPDIAVRMLNLMERSEIDVLSALYQYKEKPHSPVLYIHTDPEVGYSGIGDWDKDLLVCECSSSGGGCLLVKRGVYNRIRDEIGDSPFDIIHPYSEDHSFFRRLEQLEIKAYFAPGIQCPHLAVQEITLENYERDRIELGERHEVQGVIYDG